MAQVTTNNIITTIRGLIKDLLNASGRNGYQYDSDTSFKLSSDRVSASTITVYRNGTDITSANWSYNANTNKVTITSTLVSQDSIIITYSFYEKYSDTEITNYIKSNLAQFTRYRYFKHFYMTDANEVVSLNEDNPTLQEGNLISLVTAIDIDPQNIEIKTRDFSITPSENKSKSEQISELVRGFNRGYISLDFMEIEL